MKLSRIAVHSSVLVLLTALIALVVVIQAKQVQRAAVKNQTTNRANNRLVVHEWGTFTSIAGKDGVSLEWKPLNGASDLPGFVYDASGLALGTGLRHRERCVKCNYEALVRMETPVIYFYADRKTVVSVRVDFSKGKITEWYPQARGVYVPGPEDERNPSSLDWGRITILPGSQEDFPVDGNASHYYAARETDAAPLRVCGAKGEQREKFLFYRGVGSFDQPLSVKLESGRIIAKDNSSEEVKHVILFENHNGQIGYSWCVSGNGEMNFPRPRTTLGQTREAVEEELEGMLLTQGLYEKEAEAMIKTWRDSWFEEGLRVFYILPRKEIDSVLPLSIEPRPTELKRVLVGRIEIITPEMEKEIGSSLTDSSRDLKPVAEEIMRKHGRFAEPVLKDLLKTASDPALRERIQKVISYEGSGLR
jgi:hypothetical protein